ncbi:MAG: choice-of-anchor L domain-containing protein [Saprospiraceae bacterium]
MKTKNLLLILILTVFSNVIYAQFTVTDFSQSSVTLNQWANSFTGTGVTVSNVAFQGDSSQIGAFNGATGSGLQNGLILSSGNVNNGNSPNTAGGTTTQFNTSTTTSLLSSIVTGTINDYAILSLDFVPFGDTIIFNYVFASEEYPEWVGSSFNDVFGFFLIDSAGSYQNIALIPGTTLPVSINNVNAGSNAAYYVTNTLNQMEYDGYTTVLQAKAVVVPNQTYTLQLAISDVGDGAFDSAIFLEFGSFSSISNNGNLVGNILTPDFSDEIHEGCLSGSVNFVMTDTLPNDTTIYYTIGGTAQNGVDYQMIADSAIIPAGQFGVQIPIIPITDALTEGQENILIAYQKDSVTIDTLEMFINEPSGFLPVAFTDTTVCINDPLNVAYTGIQTGNTFLWQYALLPTIISTNQVASVFTNGSTTIAGIQTTSKGCIQVDTVNITVETPPNPIVSCQAISSDSIIVTWTSTGNITQVEVNIDNNGWISANDGLFGHVVSGLTALSQVGIQVRCFGLCADSIPVIDSSFCTTLSCDVMTSMSSTPVACFGSCDGTATVITNSGTAPYIYTWSNGITQNTATINNLCSGLFYVTITDANGCTGVDSVIITEPLPINVIVNVTNSLTGQSTGSATTIITGGFPPYTFTWSGGSSTNLAGGNYTVTVTDANNCSDIIPFTINDVNCVVTGNAQITDVSCFGASDGIITFSVTQASGNYNFVWSNGDTTATINNLAIGNYSVTVTDSLGCALTNTYNITQPDSIDVQFMIMSDSMNLGIGSAIPFISGGTSPYNLIWSGGDSINLTQGNYSLTVTDANNCTGTYGFYIDNTVSTNDLINENEINVFPNPANNFINIRLNFDKNYAVQLKIISTDGRLVQNIQTETSQMNNLKISVSDLPKGMYIMQFVFENQIVTKRVLVH